MCVNVYVCVCVCMCVCVCVYIICVGQCGVTGGTRIHQNDLLDNGINNMILLVILHLLPGLAFSHLQYAGRVCQVLGFSHERVKNGSPSIKYEVSLVSN